MSFFNSDCIVNFFRRIQGILFPLGIPLAWNQLVSSQKRFIAIVVSTIAVSLMLLIEISMYIAVEDQVIRPHTHLNADLFMIGKQYQNFDMAGLFSKKRLIQAIASKYVDSVSPLYISGMSIKDSEERTQTDVAILAVNPLQKVFKSEKIYEKQKFLKNKDCILYDIKSKSSFKYLVQKVKEEKTFDVLLNNKKVAIVGFFEMGNTIGRPEHVLISDTLFFELQKNYPQGMISIGLIKLKSGVDKKEALRDIETIIPHEDIEILTLDDFANKEQIYWMKRTPVGIIVLVGMILSVSVGIFVIYQILYNDISSHLGEYATLKAMGFSKWYFTKIVIYEALIMCCMGFLPASILACIVFYFIRLQINMPLFLSMPIIIVAFLIVLSTSFIAGLLVSTELRKADPADVF